MRLVTPVRVLAQRFAVPLLVVASAMMIVLGKADALLFDRVRMVAADFAAPILDLVARPLAGFDALSQRVHSMAALYSENERLHKENARLLQWQQVALNLNAENQRLRGLLNLVPEPTASFVSAKVIANSGGTFVRSILVNAGSRDGVVRGQAVIAGEGLVGRVGEVGERTARVLLLTDLNSHIPVIVESSRERAVLTGDNSEQPRLAYLPVRSPVHAGDRIVTSGHGGVFPPGLPVGSVASIDSGVARVEPFVELSRVDFVRIVDYGLAGVLPQPVPPAMKKGRRGAGAAAASEEAAAP
jgi:rod shape-determining protein MreC